MFLHRLCNSSLSFISQLGGNPTSVDSVVVGADNEVKMKPGQQLHIVNQLYPYTVQFKEDITGNHSGTKRPRESAPEDKESRREAQKMKAAKETEKVSVSVSPGEAKNTSVRTKQACVLISQSSWTYVKLNKHVTWNLS